jgi:predicted transcriptional regulator
MKRETTAQPKKPPVKRNMPIRRFTCPDELWNSADRVGREIDRSVSWLIRKALEEYIERHRAAKKAAKHA